MSGQMQTNNDELLRGKKNLENTREQRAMDNLERRNVGLPIVIMLYNANIS